MVKNLIEFRKYRLHEARCPDCGARTSLEKVAPSWNWICNSDKCGTGGMWFDTRRKAEDNLLERAYSYEKHPLFNEQ